MVQEEGYPGEDCPPVPHLRQEPLLQRRAQLFEGISPRPGCARRPMPCHSVGDRANRPGDARPGAISYYTYVIFEFYVIALL